MDPLDHKAIVDWVQLKSASVQRHRGRGTCAVCGQDRIGNDTNLTSQRSTTAMHQQKAARAISKCEGVTLCK
jgi:hypothetical protein